MEKHLKYCFIEFAKQRALESKGTPYEWDFNQLYPRPEDIDYFIAIIEGYPKCDWKSGEHWDDIIDWFEDLPVY
jgi:hypothetical protein